MSSGATVEDSGVQVDVDDRQHGYELDAERHARLLAAVLADSGVSLPAEVGLAFVGVREMTALNVEHMGGTGPTDVLAFPVDGADAVPPGQPALVGDIVLCPQVAAAAAQPIADEIALLIVHGALHLVGHDHAEPQEAVVMRRIEQEMLDRHHRDRVPGGSSAGRPNEGAGDDRAPTEAPE